MLSTAQFKIMKEMAKALRLHFEFSDNKYTISGNVNGHNCNYIFDKDGNLIGYKNNSTGYYFVKKYDSKGNMIYYKDSDGLEETITYDENGTVIGYKNSDAFINDSSTKDRNPSDIILPNVDKEVFNA